jgi:hypothetical protein
MSLFRLEHGENEKDSDNFVFCALLSIYIFLLMSEMLLLTSSVYMRYVDMAKAIMIWIKHLRTKLIFYSY